MKKSGFTLIEILVIFALVSLVSGVAYRIMSGTFSQFFKSQTKLTNLRAASLILERLKYDIRLAIAPASSAEKAVLKNDSGKTELEFYIRDHEGKKKVSYNFKNGIVEREVDGKKRKLNPVKVADFSIQVPEEGKSKMLMVSIVVDRDKDLEDKDINKKGNKVELRAILFPRFFQESLSDEEKYWNLARNF